MKTIPAALKLDIEDASNAGLLSTLPPAVVEKDVHITDVLQALARMRPCHRVFLQSPARHAGAPATLEVATRMVFSGGTCLAKAHGLIERMSEDIDIKVVLDPVPEGYALPKGQSDRKRLGDLYQHIEREMLGLGFALVQGDGVENPEIRNNRRHCGLALAYSAQFQDVAGALRPQLRLELMHRHPLLPLEMRELGYLLDTMVPGVLPQRFTMPVISVAETLAEKILAFLRRSARGQGTSPSALVDDTLVRHVYDVWRIAHEQPQAIEAALNVFATLVAREVNEYGVQDVSFAQSPCTVLRTALGHVRAQGNIQKHFEVRLKPLLFAAERPEFDTCFDVFSTVAAKLLDACRQP